MDKTWIHTKYIIAIFMLIWLTSAANDTAHIILRYTNYTAIPNATIGFRDYSVGSSWYYLTTDSNGSAYYNNTTLGKIYEYIVYINSTPIYNNTVFLVNTTYIYVPNNNEYTFENIIISSAKTMAKKAFLLINIGIIIVSTYVWGLYGLAYGAFIATIFIGLLTNAGVDIDSSYLILNLGVIIVGVASKVVNNGKKI